MAWKRKLGNQLEQQFGMARPRWTEAQR